MGGSLTVKKLLSKARWTSGLGHLLHTLDDFGNNGFSRLSRISRLDNAE